MKSFNKSMKSEFLSLEEILCPLCSSGEFSVRFSREDLNTMVPGSFTVVRCKKCNHMYLNPRPTINSIKNDIYTEEYDQYQKADKKFSIQNTLQNYGFHKRYKIISKYAASGKILDVGCASGEFLKYMLNFPQWNLVGLEPIAQAANLAREQLDIEIINNTLTEHVFSEDEYDVVTFWHVFEHVEDPINILTIVNKILRDEGIIVITLPILNSIDHRLFGKYWIGFELPRHLHFFTHEKMVEILNNTGFEFIESRCVYGSHAMTMTSLKFWIRSRKIFSEKFLNVFMKILMSFPIRILLAPIYLLFDRLKLSTPITFVAKKCAN
jgi:2-polyprenyl-3-methyl-5-hydroxy-6-metoxy-1,4-benzoquinol methylase